MGFRVTPIGILGIAAVAFLIAGYLLIPACALVHFGGIWDVGCRSKDDLTRDAERLALARESRDTQRRIDILEAQLAAKRCVGEHPEFPTESVPPPKDTDFDRTDLLPLPGDEAAPDDRGPSDDFADEEGDEPPLRDEDYEPDSDDTDGADDEGASDVDTDAGPEFDAPRDLADLEGCWSLESELEFRMSGGDGGTQPFPEWNVCFKEDSDGNGTQVMRSDDGMLCEGPIQGDFNADGALVLTEDGDLVCNDGTEIFQRTTTCEVDDRGVAVCESVQPSTGGRGSFTLKRN